jgi:hypothetical protein
MWTGHHHGEGERLTLDDFNVVKRVVKHWEQAKERARNEPPARIMVNSN